MQFNTIFGYHEAHQQEGIPAVRDCVECMCLCDYCHKVFNKSEATFYDTIDQGITALCPYCEDQLRGDIL